MKNHKKFSRLVAHSTLVTSAAAVVMISGVGGVSSPTMSSLSNNDGQGGLIDKTASAYIASDIATQLNLVLAPEVTEHAQNLASNATLTVAADHYLNKPHVVATDAKSSRDITTYTVQEGDSLAKLANKYNVTTDTLRWANDLGEGVEPQPGRKLTILPVSGVLHTVADGETMESLARKYQADKQRIISFNDSELSGIKPGQKLVIPDGIRPAPARSPVPSFGSFAVNSFAPTYGGNGYDYGWCTWHVANRRMQMGQPIPSNWGNAISWRYSASASGYATGTQPAVGAVAYNNYVGGLGHVSFVEEVHGDTVIVSDMNYPYWGVATRRSAPASDFTYIY